VPRACNTSFVSPPGSHTPPGGEDRYCPWSPSADPPPRLAASNQSVSPGLPHFSRRLSTRDMYCPEMDAPGYPKVTPADPCLSEWLLPVAGRALLPDVSHRKEIVVLLFFATPGLNSSEERGCRQVTNPVGFGSLKTTSVTVAKISNTGFTGQTGDVATNSNGQRWQLEKAPGGPALRRCRSTPQWRCLLLSAIPHEAEHSLVWRMFRPG